MAATSTLVSLTSKATGGAVKLSGNKMIWFNIDPIAPATGTLITYDNGDGTVRHVTVTETPANVAAASAIHIPVTYTSNGATVTLYIAVDRITWVTANGSGARITYYSNGASESPDLLVLETAANIQTAANALVYQAVATVDLTTNQSIAGVKDFTNATAATTKDAGGLITQGGVAIEKNIITGTSIVAGTSIASGTTLTAGTTFTANAGVVFAGIETIAAGGTTTALSLTKSLHSVDADAGGDIFTLADGTIGQIMTITMKSDTGVATITPANLAGGTSVTLNAAGDSVVLQFVDTDWYILGGNSYAVV